MSSNVVKLGDICKIGSSKRIKRDDYVENGIPFFRSKEIIELSKGNSISTELFIAKDQYNQINEKFGSPDTGDILITSVGTLGVAYQVEQSQLPFYFKDGNLTWLSQFSEDVNPRWVLYWLNSPEGQRKIDEISIGSTQRAITIVALKSIEVQLPHKDEQDRTVKILDSVTGKISTNNKTNQTLEQIAQAIFKSWFVDFDPVKAKIEALAAGGNADDAELAAMGVISAKTVDELNSLKASNPEAFNKLAQTAALFPKDLDSETGTPAGWNSGVIADIVKLNANSWTKKNRPEQVHYVDLSNTKNGRIETVTTYGFDEAPSRARRILNSGDTIIGTVRPGNRAFAFIGETEKPLTGSTGFAVLSPKEEFWTSFVYLATTNDDAIDEYARLADGGAYPAIKPEVVADTPCVFPTKDIAQKFWQLTGAMLKKAHQARLENEELAKTRDTLLPKLLSGEINVTSEVVA
ncbi:restriction endonuclease subunit S [Vibrio cholerae]|uniref:restriction endonuclease subunit S n=1 Tax=Vibrio cholerae TaxID=666 RepID=UPI00215C6966|nr:restriction endonuclease subunit S [Vibrio cholerae]MCR9793938.1 restriction endonuclease subunit S [Vibrio cholerae]